MAYSGDVTNLSASLRSFPPLLRPLVHPFLKATRVLSGDFDVARNHLFPMIANRRSSSEKEKPLDILQWLLDGAKGQDAEPEQIMLKCVFFLLASVHTTTMSTVHALFDLCSMPEQIGILRCEIEEALAIEKGWTMRTLHRLRKMDSFIKESQRMNPMGLGRPFSPISAIELTHINGSIVQQAHPRRHHPIRRHIPALWSSPRCRSRRSHQRPGQISRARNFQATTLL